jgi:hypothetical protein
MNFVLICFYCSECPNNLLIFCIYDNYCHMDWLLRTHINKHNIIDHRPPDVSLRLPAEPVRVLVDLVDTGAAGGGPNPAAARARSIVALEGNGGGGTYCAGGSTRSRAIR